MISRKIQLVLVFFIGALIVFYLYRNRGALSSLGNLSLLHVFFLMTARLILLLGNGFLLNVFALKFGVALKAREWVGLSFITGLGNYIAPLSFGMVMRAAYLKKKHDFPFTDFITILGSTYLINFLCVGIIGLLCSSVLYMSALLDWQVPVFFLLLNLGLIVLMIIPIPAHLGDGFFLKKAGKAMAGWDIIRKDHCLLWKITGITVFNIFFNGLSFWIAYAGLGVEVSILQAFVISLIGIFSLLLNVTPANLGIQEVIVGLASGHILVNGGPEGLLAALVVRAATVILVFIVGGLFFYILMDELKSPERGKL